MFIFGFESKFSKFVGWSLYIGVGGGFGLLYVFNIRWLNEVWSIGGGWRWGWFGVVF